MRKIVLCLILSCAGIGVDRMGSDCCLGAAPATSSAPAGKAKAVVKEWVHVQVKDLSGAQKTETEVESGNAVKAPELYINKAQGSKCEIMGERDNLSISFFSVSSSEMARYDRKQGMVAFGVMHPQYARKVRQEIDEFPLTLEEVVARLKEQGAVIVQFDQKAEGGMERADISYIPGKDCKTCPDEGGRDVVWIDPATRRIQKIQTQLEHPQEVTYRYEKKDYPDVYAFGVPRTARVLDSRPSPEAKAMLDRLDRRFENDFGTYTAVLTETDHREGREAKKMFLHLYARDGAKLLYVLYAFREKEYPDSPMFGLQGWPRPKVADVLTLTDKTIPLFYFSTDGTKVWTGTFNQVNVKPEKIKEHETLFKDYPFTPDYCLPSHVWKGREELSLYGFGPKADTVTDPAHPKRIGLRLREGDFTPGSKPPQRREKIFWLDPARDDVPVSSIDVTDKIGKGNDVIRTEFSTQYDQYGQLPGGAWYPTHWLRKASQTKTSAPKAGGYSREFHLQIEPNKQLGPRWYGNRTRALEAAGVKMK